MGIFGKFGEAIGNKLKQHRKLAIGGLSILLALGLVLSGIQFGIFPIGSSQHGRVLTIGQHELVLTIGTASAATTTDYTCDGTADDAQFTLAINALPNTGGKLEVLGGTYNFTATVSRNINNVTIEGVGVATYFEYGASAVFSAGSQSGWVFRDFSTSSGGINVSSATAWTMQNVRVGSAYYAYRTSSDITASNWPAYLAGGGTSLQTADYILYQDADGYKALRTYDNAVVSSNATDFGTMLNNLLSSLTLIQSANVWSPAQLTYYKQGLTIVSTVPFAVFYTPIVFPPTQDFIFDAGYTELVMGTSMTSAITIDSASNVRMNFGIIATGDTGLPADIHATNLVYLYPHTNNTWSYKAIDNLEVNIRAISGNVTVGGVTVDATAGFIRHTFVTIVESALNNSGVAIGSDFYIPNPDSYYVSGCRFTLKEQSFALHSVTIDTTTKVYKNIFDIDWAEYTTADIVDNSTGIYGTNTTNMQSNPNQWFTNPMPSIYYTGNTTQSATTGTWTTITNLTNKAWDNLSEFNTTTGVYTATVPGYYSVTGQVYMNTTNNTGSRGVVIYKNSTIQVADSEGCQAGSADVIINCSNGAVFLDKGDTLKMQTRQDSGGTGTIQNGVLTYISINKVR